MAVFIYGKTLFHDRFYNMLLLPLLSKLILKENLHKHHYLSLAISIIGWTLLNIPICLKIQMNDLLANFINLVNAAIYLLFIVLIKYISNKFYVSPLQTSLIFGLISIILLS